MCILQELIPVSLYGLMKDNDGPATILSKVGVREFFHDSFQPASLLFCNPGCSLLRQRSFSGCDMPGEPVSVVFLQGTCKSVPAPPSGPSGVSHRPRPARHAEADRRLPSPP